MRRPQKKSSGSAAASSLGEHAGGDAEAACLLQRAEHVPGERALAVLVAEPRRLGIAPPAGDRLGDQLAADDEVVERALEDVGRCGRKLAGGFPWSTLPLR